jgi:hypothetical protein
MIGSTMAKLWADAKHDVRIASRHPEALAPIVETIGPHASAGSPLDAAQFGEVVMITVPLSAVPDLAREVSGALAGKIVLDTNNFYERRDGATAQAAAAHPQGSAGWDATHFPGARWVKAFNTVYFKTLETEAHRSGDQVGIPLASDDSDALQVVSGLVRDAGFDPVVVGGLGRGKEFEPDTPIYNTGMSGRDIRAFFEKTRA